jgi:mRNA interferase MazF
MLGVVRTNNYQNGFNNLIHTNENVNNNINRIVFRGDIVYADLGVVTGSEQGGLRPVVIIQNNMGNKYSTTVIVATLTTRTKKNLPTHVILKPEQTGLDKENILLLEQIRTLDKTRLQDGTIGKCTEEAMKNIDEAIMKSLGITFDEVEGYLRGKELKRIKDLVEHIEEIDEIILEEQMLGVEKLLRVRKNMILNYEELCQEVKVDKNKFYNYLRFRIKFNSIYGNQSNEHIDII